MCGYLRYYYPTEFCTSFLNCAKNDEDIANGTLLAQSKGCKIETPLFRFSTSDYGCDADNKVIYKGIGSIKDISKKCGDNLYNLKDNYYYDFVDLLYDIDENKCADKTEMTKLIYIDFFKEFGDINLLLETYRLFQLLHKRNTFSVNELEKYNVTKEEVSKLSEKTTEKRFSGVNMKQLIRLISRKFEYEKTTDLEHISYELGVLGYTNYSDETVEDNIYVISNIEENKYGNHFATLYSPKYKTYKQYKVHRGSYSESPCDVGDIVKVAFKTQNKKYKDENDDWVASEETETILRDYLIIKKFQIKK